MPGEKGVEFLERARRLHPEAIRILTTAYSDFDVAIEAVNSAAIYKYVTKPWDIPELEIILNQACEPLPGSGSMSLVLKQNCRNSRKRQGLTGVLNLTI